MSRRSERLKAQNLSDVKKPFVDSTPPDSDSEYEQPEWEPFEPATRRRSHGGAKKDIGKRVRGKRGSLQRMLEMPLDVLFEIFAYLCPMDLLNLARTTKDLRAFLMKRSAVPFWRAARLNVEDLPSCPEDLTEPAYANLLFDAHCHICLQKNCQSIQWECRIRLCKKCSRELTVSIGWPATLRSILGDKPALTCVSIYEIIPMLYDHNDYPYGYSPYVDELKASIERMDETEIENHLKSMKKRLSNIKDTVDELSGWYASLKDHRSDELHKLRSERWQQITEKLKELGWQPELDFMDSGYCHRTLRSLPEVKKPQALTPRVWQNIEQRILDFLAEIHVERLARDRKKVLEQRLRSAEKFVRTIIPKFDLITPSPLEVCARIPEILEMVEAKNDHLSLDSLEEMIKAKVPNYIEKRLEDARIYFRDLVRKEIDLDGSVDPLTLAVGSLFTCNFCQSQQIFPDVLGHSCSKRWTCLGEEPGEFINFVVKNIYPALRVFNQSAFCSEATKIREYVNLYGLDPKTATAADMDACEVRLKSDQRTSNPLIVAIQTWRSAFKDCGPECKLERIPDDQAAFARRLEVSLQQVMCEARDRHPEWRCAHCSTASTMVKTSVKYHLQTAHSVTEPTEDDWYRDTSSVDFPKPVLLVAEELRDTPLNWGVRRSLDEGTADFYNFS